MLATEDLNSLVAWNSAVYSESWSILTIVLILLRVMLTVLHKKYYSRPVAVGFFATGKFVIDYFMFEGVERFSVLPEPVNTRIITGLEVFYVILANYMIYSIFYADFVLPCKAIIQFTAANLVSAVVAMSMLIELEDRLTYLLLVIGIHVIGFVLYLDKCIGLIKCDLYNSTGRLFIYMTMLLHVIFNHALRILYLSNLLLGVLGHSLSLDRFLYIGQLVFSFLLTSVFIFYRCRNTDKITLVFVAAKKLGRVETILDGFGRDYIFKNAPEELMFPADNDLNTVSDASFVEDSEVAVELPEDVGPVKSPSDSAVFTTRESGRTGIHISRNRVASEECEKTIRPMTS